jgi:hypothetical protein
LAKSRLDTNVSMYALLRSGGSTVTGYLRSGLLSHAVSSETSRTQPTPALTTRYVTPLDRTPCPVFGSGTESYMYPGGNTRRTLPLPSRRSTRPVPGTTSGVNPPSRKGKRHTAGASGDFRTMFSCTPNFVASTTRSAWARTSGYRTPEPVTTPSTAAASATANPASTPGRLIVATCPSTDRAANDTDWAATGRNRPSAPRWRWVSIGTMAPAPLRAYVGPLKTRAVLVPSGFRKVVVVSVREPGSSREAPGTNPVKPVGGGAGRRVAGWLLATFSGGTAGGSIGLVPAGHGEHCGPGRAGSGCVSSRPTTPFVPGGSFGSPFGVELAASVSVAAAL